MTTKTKEAIQVPAVKTPNKWDQLRLALNARYLERTELVDGMLVALISGEPCILIGPPGTAKSAICKSICDAIQGRFFSWMLTRFTVPEELFGPFSLKGLEQDKYVRITKGKMPEADIVFLDEVGKASSSISNTNLTILNEKTFYNDGQAVKVPLLVLFGASNEVPQSEELSAFYDRFVLRYFVEPVIEESSIRTLFSGNFAQVPMVNFTIKEVAQARTDAEALRMPNDVIEILLHIRREVQTEGLLVSDRKWAQAMRVIRAFAYLNGHTQVTADDVEILTALLWSTPDQVAKARKIVSKFANPMGEKIMQTVDAVRELDKELKQGKGDAVEIFKKVKHAARELEKLQALSDKPNPKLTLSLTFVKDVQRYIAKNHLGLDD